MIEVGDIFVLNLILVQIMGIIGIYVIIKLLWNER